MIDERKHGPMENSNIRRGGTDKNIQSSRSTESGAEVHTGRDGVEIGDVTQGKDRGQETNKEEVENLTDYQKFDEINQLVGTSMERGLLSFNNFDIKKKYPKAYNHFVKYLEKKAQYPIVDEYTVIGILFYTPRMIIFSFFDDQEIFINTNGDKDGWDYYISYGENDLFTAEGEESRTRTEFEAVYKAFQLLEEQLK